MTIMTMCLILFCQVFCGLKNELTTINRVFILICLFIEIYSYYRLVIVGHKIKISTILCIIFLNFTVFYSPELMFPYIEYKSYLQQASNEGDEVAKKFSLEMNNKRERDIYNELYSRVKKGHKEYIMLQSKLEEIKKNDKRRESLIWMHRAMFNVYKNNFNKSHLR